MGILDSIMALVSGGKEPTASQPVPGLPVESAEPSTKLEEDDKGAVRQLIQRIQSETDTTRRWEIQRKRKGREYFAGRQWIFWDEGKQSYVPIGGQGNFQYGLDDTEDDSDPIYTWNLYQATGLFIISVITGSRPTVRFFPNDAANENDVATARAASDIVALFDRINQIEVAQQHEAYLSYTDGFVAAYVRHVVDGKRFGYHDQDIQEMVPTQIAPGGFMCQQCGFTTTDEEILVTGQACKGCGGLLAPEAYQPPQMAETLQTVGVEKVENGAELVDFYGALEVRVPPNARDQSEYMFLALNTEVDIAVLKAKYPEQADFIRSGASMGDAVLQEERQARLSVQGGGWQAGTSTGVQEARDTVTFSRVWLRPAALYRLTDKSLRDKLLGMFPDGLFIAVAGNTVCETRNENMDDFWVTYHAYPGDGQMRPSIGDVLLDPQDAVNDLLDSEMQIARHAIPSLFVDSETVDTRAWSQSRARGGNVYQVQRRDDSPVGANFFESTPSAHQPGITVLRQEIFGPISQQLTGALPAATGQGDPNLKTFRAYSQARDQALQRLGIVWKNIKAAHVRIAMLAVQHFIKYRTEDVSFAEANGGGFANRTIRKADLQGQIVAYPEADEAFPVSAADYRETINMFLQSQDPTIHGAVVAPENFDSVKGKLGVGFLKFPGEQARRKQMEEIKKLLQTAPIPSMDPMTGMPAIDMMTGQPLPPQCSIPIKPITDQHQFEFGACVEWLNSPTGLEIEQSNPVGFANVMLHATAHFTAMQPPPMPAGAEPGAEGEAPPPPEGGPPQ